jgi:hypothetical protein
MVFAVHTEAPRKHKHPRDDQQPDQPFNTAPHEFSPFLKVG